jgi:hypothetical protein
LSAATRHESELSSAGEETAGKAKVGKNHIIMRPKIMTRGDANDGERIDEDIGIEGVADDLLQPDYVGNRLSICTALSPALTMWFISTLFDLADSNAHGTQAPPGTLAATRPLLTDSFRYLSYFRSIKTCPVDPNSLSSSFPSRLECLQENVDKEEKGVRIRRAVSSAAGERLLHSKHKG